MIKFFAFCFFFFFILQILPILKGLDLGVK